MSNEVVDTTNEWAIAEREAKKIEFSRQYCLPDLESVVVSAYTHGFLAGMAFQKKRAQSEEASR